MPDPVSEKARPVPTCCAVCKWLIFEKTHAGKRAAQSPSRASTVGARRCCAPAFPQVVDFAHQRLSSRADSHALKYGRRNGYAGAVMRKSALIAA
jgi:hypothetical protein